ncbi:bidirectional hydrogenase complex protein HoxE [Desulfotalea psychrophila]|uniref:Probable NADH dehydrogenase (Ubiquinone) I, chain E n=1 Tax=Desulfotalea psychrophila (strain LSv54 / DSM 12343) TaxID=177439 RepID=Q6AL38_DESPS|nr:bidirectional hydrogenase complex protein HoxE [Desulfotalea psychrophila]CAG36937.1 probable NADH dehydrogenase (ubiquinone) I, chain E [Desulfotalea psychrophila LSv54]
MFVHAKASDQLAKEGIMVHKTDKISPTQENSAAAADQNHQWRMVDRAMRSNGNRPEALIETLHTVQNTFGFIDRDAMEYVASGLHVPLSQVYSVATFYHYFTLKPPGEHTCVVCTGTACYVSGSSALLETIHNTVGIDPGETSQDGKVSLLTTRCLGSCGLAPAAVFDGQVAGKLQSATIEEKMRGWMRHDPDA